MPYWAIPPYGSCSDSTQYQLTSVEPSDSSYIPTIVSYKQNNPRLKVLLSIGGWNFPSAFFSKMVSSSQNRAMFIQSAVQLLNQYQLDGIDIDWEYPCSPSRVNSVEISCTEFRNVQDNGGNCPADTQNLVSFARELKAALGSKLLTIASQAAKANEMFMNVKAVTPYIDKWHIMSYDYAVSDLPTPSVTSPNCPLYNPSQPSAVQMSVNQTLFNYLNAGVPPSKIMIGLALYGHTWYTPGASNWEQFGLQGKIQGSCCGPFQQTYGAQPGKGSSLCGTMMYSEIQAAQPMNYFDQQTQSTIGYWSQQGADGYTAPGTWISYNDAKSLTAITKYGMENNVDGVFVFDSSMDSVSNGAFTFELMNVVANTLQNK